MGKLRIDIGIDHRNKIYAYHADDTEVTLTAIHVLALAQYIGQPFFI